MATETELQGKFMIFQGKATDLGKEIRAFAKDINDPTLMYFAGQAMMKLEECMHRVHDMFTRAGQLSEANLEKLEDEAIKSGKVVDFTTGKPV